MQITPINNYYSINYNTSAQDVRNLAFASKTITKSKISQKLQGKSEMALRVIINKISDFFTSKESKNLINLISKIKPAQTNTYLAQIAAIARHFSSEKTMDCNTEDNILEKLAQSNKSVIFMMTHSNQQEDPQMLAVLNLLLADAYKAVGTKFLIPQIVLNEDILNSMNTTKKQAYKNMGAVGIDANVFNGNKSTNTRAFLPLLRGAINDECNIFIFPEGKLAQKRNSTLFERFQPGVANMVNKILSRKNEVTVVPIGFAYGKGENRNINAIQIGTPLKIKRIGEVTTITAGDIAKGKYTILKDYFEKNKDKEDIPITNNGKSVPPSEVSDYLVSILCENLEINENIAKEKVKIPLGEENIDRY